MKRLFITAVVLAASTASFAQTQISGTPVSQENTPVTAAAPAAETMTIDTATAKTATVTVIDDETRKQIKIEELPAAVRADLNTVQYKGWAPSLAYWVSDDKDTWYEITMVSGDESKIVKYNGEGSKLD